MPAVLFGQAEEKLQEKITISFNNEDLAAALQKIQTAHGIPFMFDAGEVKKVTKKYKVSFTQQSLAAVLGKLLQGTEFSFQPLKEKIILRKTVTRTVKVIQADAGSLTAAKGGISGKVVDFENGDPLVGATVSVEGQVYSAVTDEKGDYSINNVPGGTYTLLITYVGYRSERVQLVKVEDSKMLGLDIKLQVNIPENAVIVKAFRRRKVVNSTDQQLIAELYNSRTVISGISNEQIARTMDRDAAEIVKRIPGVNISDDRFIVVRGLNKRYNLTFLNDNLAPATELDSRAFSFDLLSSNVIDKIMVYKSPSPDLPGEFAGGVVKVTTKKSQLTKQLDIQLSAQYRPHSSFSFMPDYAGSKTDVLGYDDGSRDLPKGIPNSVDFNLATPAINAQYSKMFQNNYMIRNERADLDKRVVINYYDAWRIGSKLLNNLTSVSYTNTEELRSSETQSRYKTSPEFFGLLEQGMHNARVSLLQNNNMIINDHLRLELKQFLNQQGSRVAFVDYRNVPESRAWLDQKRTALYYRSSFLYSGQLSSYLNFGEGDRTRIYANIGYNTIHRNDPDLREIGYSRTRDENIAFNRNNPAAPWMHGSWETVYPASRYFVDVQEQAYQANADAEHRINKILNLKAGVFYETRQRDLTTRSFRLTNGVYSYHPDLFIPNPEGGDGIPNTAEWALPTMLDPGNFRTDGTGLRWREVTTPNDQYFAQNDNTAGYLSADLKLLEDKLNFFGGLRVEHNRFRILGSRATGQANYPLVVNQPISSWLPSVNVSYRPDSTLIIRAGFGKTVNRPEFREAAPFQFFDYLNFETYYGTPTLTTVNINNYDIRFEFYPRSMLRNEMFNLGFFYKEMDHPIENVWAKQVGHEAKFNTFYFINTGPAKIYGIEGELRKSLAFFPGKFFRDLTVIVNGAWIKSEVRSPGLPFAGHAKPRNRPLQGQVPYLVNASLNYENPGWGTKLSVTYHTSGDQIYSLGTADYTPGNISSGFPDIMEKGRHLLDLSWSQRVNKLVSIKAGVQNILNSAITQYQDYNRDYKYTPESTTMKDGIRKYEGDVISRRYYANPYYSLGFNFTL